MYYTRVAVIAVIQTLPMQLDVVVIVVIVLLPIVQDIVHVIAIILHALLMDVEMDAMDMVQVVLVIQTVVILCVELIFREFLIIREK